MRRFVTPLLATCAFVALGAAGLFAARAVLGDETADAPPRAVPELVALGAPSDADALEGGTVTAADLSLEPDRLIQVIGPAAVGGDRDDTAPGEILLAEPTQLPGAAGDTDLAPVGEGIPGGETPGDVTGDADPLPDGGTPVTVAASGSASAPEVVGAIGVAEPIPDDVGDGEPVSEPAASADEPADAATLGLPSFLAITGGFDWIDRLASIVFDPCAGAAIGDEVPGGCPLGYAATFGGSIATPPPPMIFAYPGHTLAGSTSDTRGCPSAPAASDTTAEMTLATHTPLAEATFRYRPYGSSEPWVVIELEPTIDSERDWWFDRFESGDTDVFGRLLTSCFSVAHDPAVPYEFHVTAVDVFGQPVEQQPNPRLLPADRPDRRPRPVATIAGLSPVATVSAWSTTEGSVTFRAREIRDPDGPMSCDGADPLDPAQLLPRGGEPPTPAGLYDPAYRVRWTAVVPLPAGVSVLVCADVRPDDNPLRVQVTDRVLLTAPSQESPRIVVQGVRRAGDRTIERGMWIEAGESVATGGYGPCDRSYRFDELAPGRTHSLEQTIWECVGAPVPADRSGSLEVPVRIVRRPAGLDPRTPLVIEAAIPISLSDCREAPGCRPREWYEVPVPIERGGLCGSSFGSGCEPPTDGIIVLRVDYPVVGGAAGVAGEARLLDEVVPVRPDAPQATRLDTRFEAGSDVFHRDGVFSLVADRPVTMTVTPIRMSGGGPDACPDPAPVTSDGFSERPSVRFEEMCGGHDYSLSVLLTDEAGVSSELDWWGVAVVPSARSILDAQLTLLGGPDVPELGFVYRIDVRLEGQSQTNYWWETTTPRRGTASSCVAMNGTRFSPNGVVDTYVVPPTMSVHVEVEVTTTGDGDCSGRSSSGLGTISFDAVVTTEQLLSGEAIVVDSPADSPLRMQLRFNPRRWRTG